VLRAQSAEPLAKEGGCSRRADVVGKQQLEQVYGRSK
jgi:hypothetical protein